MTDVALRVLVAEDNADHRFLAARALRHAVDADVEVHEVEDGEQALDFLYQRRGFEDRARPHLIVLDLRMPRVTGFEVLEQIKQDESLRSIPVVVLTSSHLPEDVDRAYHLGGNSYITKHFGSERRNGLSSLGEYWLRVSELPEPPA